MQLSAKINYFFVVFSAYKWGKYINQITQINNNYPPNNYPQKVAKGQKNCFSEETMVS